MTASHCCAFSKLAPTVIVVNVVCAIIVTGRDDSRELLLTTLVLCENSRSKGNRHLSARPEQISSNARTQEGGEEDLVEVPKQTAYSIGTNPTNNKGGFRVQKKIQPPIGTRNLILLKRRKTGWTIITSNFFWGKIIL